MSTPYSSAGKSFKDLKQAQKARITDYMYLEKGQKSFLSYTEVDRNKVIDYVTDGNTIWKASNFPDGRLKSDYAACDIVSIYKRLKLNHGAATITKYLETIAKP